MKYPSALDLGRTGADHSTAGDRATDTNGSAVDGSEHFVQFYEADSFLVDSMAAFIAEGLSAGESALVVATETHRMALNDRLREEGLDIEGAQRSGHYILLDAAETLASFMRDRMPDARLFNDLVGGLVARLSLSGRPLRAFGEMVALLWQEKNREAAIRLEELWNELGQKHRFSLFCAYPMAEFRGEADGRAMLHICKAHARVIPTESYSENTTPDERLRAITLLQQKANSLEAEIAGRKETERALARRERELSDFLENATEGIHQVLPNGRILWANKAELELLGYAAGEYLGEDIRKFHVDAEVINDILDRLTRGEKLRDYEARLRHKDGSLRYVSINSSGYWERDQFRYTRCFTRDITDRKRAADTLEQTVAERTAQLRETVAELEAFSYSISHDVRSPLRAMQGYAQSLLEDYGAQLPADAIQRVDCIQRAAHRLDLLVRDILAYSAVAKGQVDLKPVGLGPLLDDLIQQHPELQASAKNILIEPPLPVVLGHEAYLTQCLTNLIENGLKFVAPGTVPEVRVSSESLGDRVRVWISDNGIGIAPEHYGRIFQIFGRIHPPKVYPGTGIGLAIVKKAVARMNGETGFESEPGHGSRFWFMLPATARGI